MDRLPHRHRDRVAAGLGVFADQGGQAWLVEQPGQQGLALPGVLQTHHETAAESLDEGLRPAFERSGRRGGASELARRNVGTPVFGGMIFASFLGIFVIPPLYVFFQSIREKVRPSTRPPAAPVPPVSDGSPEVSGGQR